MDENLLSDLDLESKHKILDNKNQSQISQRDENDEEIPNFEDYEEKHLRMSLIDRTKDLRELDKKLKKSTNDKNSMKLEYAKVIADLKLKLDQDRMEMENDKKREVEEIRMETVEYMKKIKEDMEGKNADRIREGLRSVIKKEYDELIIDYEE